MNTYSLLTAITSIACLLLGNFIFYRNKNSTLHLMFALGYFFAGAHCFFLLGLNLSPTTDEAWIWLKLTSFLHFITPFSFHGMLILTGKPNAPIRKSYLAIVYSPFIFLFFQDLFFTELTYDWPMVTPTGWVTKLKTNSVFHIIDMSIYGLVLCLEFILLISFLLRTANKYNRKLGLFLLINIMIPILAAALLLFITPFFQNPVYRIDSIFILFVVITTAIGLHRFNIFDLTTEILSRDIISNMSNFYLLVDKDIYILESNKKATDTFGYTVNELKGMPLRQLFDQEKYETVFSRVSKDRSHTMETYCRAKSDKYIPVLLSVTQVFMKNEFEGIIIIGSDLSDVKKIQMEKEIAELELKALVSQMNPHFLFNSLNTIQYFITLKDELTANLYLSKFAGLMRRVVDHSTTNRVVLKEEIECLTLYLDLELLRLKNRFVYTLKVDDTINAFEESIPPMIIQPFIENAIWHGLHSKDGPGLLEIAFTKNAEHITCLIEDNGIGRDRANQLKQHVKVKHRSTAIKNIERRINLLNGQHESKNLRLEIIDKKSDDSGESGTIVKLYFPLALKSLN